MTTSGLRVVRAACRWRTVRPCASPRARAVAFWAALPIRVRPRDSGPLGRHDRDFDRVDLDDVAQPVTAARVSRRTRVAEVLCVGGGAALLVSAFTHWVRRGPGSRLRGHDLVDTLVALGRDLPGLSSARLTVLWYLVPALGAASWISVGLTGPASRWTRGCRDRRGRRERPRVVRVRSPRRVARSRGRCTARRRGCRSPSWLAPSSSLAPDSPDAVKAQ